MLFKRNLTPEQFDVRMIENYIREGFVTKEQLATFLGTLQDDGGNAENIAIDDESLTGNAGYTSESMDDASDD